MKTSIVILLVVILALVVDQGDCWGRRRRRRRRSGGRWSISNGGVTYSFRNGVKVTGYGSLKPKQVGVKVTIPFGRKRRSVEEEQIPPVENQLETPVEEQEPTATTVEEPAATTTAPQMAKTDESRSGCAECLEVQPIKIEDAVVENETLANNDFVMVAKFIEENKSAAKMEAKIKFEVVEVAKSPVDTIVAGETFTINAKMASCPCLMSLDPGYYIVTGSVDAQNRLVLSNVLLEFEN